MIKRLFILILLFLNTSLCAGSLYIDNFNDGASTNLLGGGYGAYTYFEGGGNISYETNTSFGNSGASLKLYYDVSTQANSGIQVWMVLKPSDVVNLTEYNYLTFRVKGDSGKEVIRIMLRDSDNEYPWVDIRNYLSGGEINNIWQKVVIPLTAFRYDKFDETKIEQFYFFIENGMGTNTGTVYFDELLLLKGAGPIYIDTVEVDEGQYDLSALSFNVYAGGNTEGAKYIFATNIITNDYHLGDYSYYLKHITQRDAVGDPWCQSVWMFNDYGITPSLDASACDTLQFWAKKGAADTGGTRHLMLGYGSQLNSGFKDITSELTTSWIEYNYPISDFTGADLEDLLDFKVVTRWNGGYITNIMFFDEIKFIDTIPPQAPANIRADGLEITNNFVFKRGINIITSTVFSNEPLDKSLEAVFMEYRKNSGNWKIISFDYNTDKTNFTNRWNTSVITGTNNIDIRISSLDSTSNWSLVLFNNCSIEGAGVSDYFVVSLSNVDTQGVVNFGSLPGDNIPKIAQNSSGDFTFAYIDYYIQSAASWEIIIYTDNTNSSASPRYQGPGDLKYGLLNDGTGLIGNGNGATNVHSTPLRIWSDAQYSDGSFAKAPCDLWKGTLSSPDLQGIPAPFYQGGETNLYWKNQDLNGNGTNDDVIQTNTHWLESTYNYDANGDGDTSDSSTGTSGNALGKVFEYSSWLPVVADDRKVTGAQTVVLIDDNINSSTPNQLKVYFAVTDDLAGSFATDHLIIELIIQ